VGTINASDLIEQIGSFSSDAAYAEIKLGHFEQAFIVVNQGRARMLSAELQQRGEKLSAEDALRLNHLTNDIKEARQRAERSDGTEGLDAIQKLATLRREVRLLLKKASDADAGQAAITGVADVIQSGGAIIAPVVTKMTEEF
jgi:hypothetical protein